MAPETAPSSEPDPVTVTAALPWGAAVARFVRLRRLLNYWRLRSYVDEGLRVEYYSTRRGIVVTSIKAVVA